MIPIPQTALTANLDRRSKGPTNAHRRVTPDRVACPLRAPSQGREGSTAVTQVTSHQVPAGQHKRASGLLIVTRSSKLGLVGMWAVRNAKQVRNDYGSDRR
jgi:hypothetical protein